MANNDEGAFWSAVVSKLNIVFVIPFITVAKSKTSTTFNYVIYNISEQKKVSAAPQPFYCS